MEPLRNTASSAVVLAVSGQSVTIDLGEGGTEVLQKLRDVTVAAGDLARVTTNGRARFVTGVIGVAPVGEAPVTSPAPPPSAIESGSWLVKPLLPGTYRGGWRADTALLWQGRYAAGPEQFGVAWYGDAPTALPGALVRCTVVLRRVEGGAGRQSPQIALYGGTMRPGGKPAVLDFTAGPGLLRNTPATWTLPDEWVARIESGEAGGLGCWLPADEPALALTAEGDGMALTCYWEDRT